MKLFSDPLEFQRQTLAWRRENLPVALVPTMGALHEGHLALMRAARQRIGPAGRLAVSVFVNPIQFNNADDLANYPRALERDAALCGQTGADAVFAPSPDAMYGPNFRTSVEVAKLTDVLCGAHRPGHFRGVTTVVLKLMLLAQPTVALFGWKDAQQFIVLRRMVQDLCLPLEMLGVDTVREPDGLAMSSRNSRLSPAERAEAPRLRRGLLAAQALFERGERGAARLIAAFSEPVAACPLFKIEYAELRSLETLDALPQAQPGNSLLAVAACLGSTRLIDNIRL